MLGMRKVPQHWDEGFPFELPAVEAIEELEAVRFTRGFLEAPERFIRAVLDDT